MIVKSKQLPISPDAWACLSALRFFLAGIVLFGHLNEFEPNYPLVTFARALDGKAAVIGFLLVSGFSIAHSIMGSPQHYYSRRFLRIYPLYFTAIVATIVLTLLIGSPFQIPNRTYVASGWPTMLANLGFLQGFLCIPIPYNGPVWTLSIEVVLYIVAPLLLRLTRMQLGFFSLASLSIFAAISEFALPWGRFRLMNTGSLLYGFSLLTLAWPWLLGFSLRKFGLGCVEFILLTIGFLIVANSDFCSGKMAWITCFSSLAVMIWAGRIKYPQMIKRIFNYGGDISYPLYLFHMPVLLLVYWLFQLKNPLLLAVLAILSAIALELIVDRWFKNRFVKPLMDQLFLMKRTFYRKLSRKSAI